MPKTLFSVPPTTELLNKACRSIGLQDASDSKWVDESAWSPTLAQEVRNDLVAHYYKCIAKTYLSRPNGYREHLTIVRQILKHFNRSLTRREKCMKVSEGTYKYYPQYQLSYAPIPETGISLAFN